MKMSRKKIEPVANIKQNFIKSANWYATMKSKKLLYLQNKKNMFLNKGE